MVFGHNTNVKIGGVTFHAQTEDRGESTALIDTTVYFQGRVLHRRTNNYFDLLPLNEDRRQALKLRLDAQHNTVLHEMQSGALQLSIPQPPELKPALPPLQTPLPISAAPANLLVELVNPKLWLSGKQVSLQIAVKDESGNPVANAQIEVHLEGTAEYQSNIAVSGNDGQAQIDFEMPKITGAEPAMVIRAEENQAKGQLRFALRAKPKVLAL
jgi:hypothetical protein